MLVCFFLLEDFEKTFIYVIISLFVLGFNLAPNRFLSSLLDNAGLFETSANSSATSMLHNQFGFVGGTNNKSQQQQQQHHDAVFVESLLSSINNNNSSSNNSANGSSGSSGNTNNNSLSLSSSSS